MKLSALDLAMIIDTLTASVSLADDGVFDYTRQARKDLLTRLANGLNDIYVTVEVVDEQRA